MFLVAAAAQAQTLDSDGSEGEAKRELTFKGRIFMRGTWQRLDGTIPYDSLDLSVPTARVGLRARVSKALALTLEADLAGKPAMKDGYIQGRWKPFTLRAGQFKMPISAIALDSLWTLPIARRGLINSILVDQMQIAGRRPGATAQLRFGGLLDPRFTAGAFQSSVWDGKKSFDLAKGASASTQNLVVRADITPGPVDAGVSVEWRTFPDENGVFQRYWTASVDAKLDWRGLRIWAEGFTGATFLVAPTTGSVSSTFLAGRTIVAWRFGGADKGGFYLEPFAAFGVLDPDRENSADAIIEAVVGINIGQWQRARLTLQGEIVRAGDNIPKYFSTSTSRPTVSDGETVILQVGAAF